MTQGTATVGVVGEDAARAAALLHAEGVRKVFRSGNAELVVLKDIRVTIREGEMVAIVGASGAGKSTLLHLLGALDTPTNGAIYFNGSALAALSDAERAEYRNRSVGFVWQRHHLLPDFTAAENVAMPLLVKGTERGEAHRVACGWLEEVGLTNRMDHRAAELSGGEQQRTAIARALAGSPRLLLADEPTGDLDKGNADAVFQLMQRLHKVHRLTSLMATHNLVLARRCDRVLALEHGILEPRDDAVLGSQAEGKRG